MKAMVLERTEGLDKNPNPLRLVSLPDPIPGRGEILIRVSVCGICHTELDEIEGRLNPSKLSIVPGHQIIGRVIGLGLGTKRFSLNTRVGIAWIYSACGKCNTALRETKIFTQIFVEQVWM